MEIGSPLPADLAEIDAGAVLNSHPPAVRDSFIKRLHAAHHAYNDEHEALYAKQRAIKATLDKLYLARDLETRASFDTAIVKQGGVKFTVAKAKQFLDDAKEGFVNLGAGVAERLKRIVDSGKDEE
jgi:Skp family chaperone for outer membrane proteins